MYWLNLFSGHFGPENRIPNISTTFRSSANIVTFYEGNEGSPGYQADLKLKNQSIENAEHRMQNSGGMMLEAKYRMESRWHLPFLVSCTLLVCMLQLALAAQMPRYGCIWLHLLELWTSNCLCRQVGCLIHGCSLSAEADRQCLCVNLFDRGSPILHTSRFITELVKNM